MKKFFRPLVLALIILFIFACVSIDLTYDPADRRGSNSGVSSITQAQAGKITIYTSMYGDVVENIHKALSSYFPNYHIEFTYGGTGLIQATIEQQVAEGSRLGCDILMIAEPSYSMELKEKGMLHPYRSKEASNLVFDYDPQGYWYPVRVSAMVLAYNPDRTPRNTIPDSFYAFAYDQSLRGAVSMSSPITSGTSLASVSALRDKYGYGYFDALGRQNVHIDSGSVALQKLEAGEYKMVMILEETVLKARAEEGSKIEIIYPSDGAIVIPSTIVIVNDKWNANMNAKIAEEIADWFLSAQGQNAIVMGWMHSVIKDDRVPYHSIPTSEIVANSMPVSWENLINDREEIRSAFEEDVIYRRAN